jgi:SSS family solute:Na+ symporter
VLLVAAGAYTLLHHPDFAAQARAARAVIASIENPQIQKQMTTPIAMTYYLPPGLLGVFAAIMLAAFISTHDTYLHSWGSVLIQDVVLPLRGKPLSPRLHVFLLRLSILGVAVFVYFFSLLFRQTEYVHMFFVITYAIFVSGAGAVVIGGLYWSRGTTRAAWAAMVTGALLSIAAVVLRQLHNTGQQFSSALLDAVAARDPAELSLSASVVAILVYVLVSLLDRRPAFNMDRMLHRGSYVVGEHVGASAVTPVRGWRARIAMGNEFNRSDQLLYLATMGLTGVLILTFLLGTMYNLVQHVSTTAWVRFWGGYIRVVLVLSMISAVWFTIGGLCDLKRMFSILAQLKRNDLDDGAVIDPRDRAG